MAGLSLASREPLSLAGRLAKNWFLVFAVVYGLWVWTPFLAPLFMRLGWDGPANAIYFVYSFFCHQLPERSYFLFGPQVNYSLAEIRAAWVDTINPLLLRQFTGAAGMGWKVAWSDRMISFYGGVWLFGLLWYPLRRRVKNLPWWGLALFLLPMALDGGTHFISDLAGIGQGFRDTNLWLAALTNSAFPADFYAGDALGSFNSWMRIITGLLAGLGLVWFAFPLIEKSVPDA
ncbi:MAG: DUF2085 domain-containing protein [Chloroflexota bacterium]